MKSTLYSLFREDQADRKLARAGKLSRRKLVTADLIRRKKARIILKEKMHLTKYDYFYASVLSHHGASPSLLIKAKFLAEKSLSLKHPKALTLLHAIEDRSLIMKGKPQRYGTHTLKDNSQSSIMSNDTKKVYVGVYGIYLKRDSVLVIKKARGPYKGKYDLPGGGIEFGETALECLRREVQEETNARLVSAKLLDINDYECQYTKEDETIKDFQHLGIYYVVELEIDAVKADADGQDSEGALFLPLNELTSENTSPIALPMIQKASHI